MSESRSHGAETEVIIDMVEGVSGDVKATDSVRDATTVQHHGVC